MTPAERLRAAAARLRELAEPIAPGPWEPALMKDDGDEWQVSCPPPVVHGRPLPAIDFGLAGGWYVAADLDESVATWIATVSPAIAEPLAKVLDRVAIRADFIATFPECPPAIRADLDTVLALADAILGGTS